MASSGQGLPSFMQTECETCSLQQLQSGMRPLQVLNKSSYHEEVTIMLVFNYAL